MFVEADIGLYEQAPDAVDLREDSQPLVIRVYGAAGDVIETHENKGDFKEP